MAEAGFIFWGLLGILAVIPVAYTAWMLYVERRLEDGPPDGSGGGAARPDPESDA